ncbi:hypothetical protein [Streptomyces microflavus]|uniref:hypothetical protein n=1 Tax=Streptomyces microflavus TaxID=1919 RepID=UPI0033B90D89
MARYTEAQRAFLVGDPKPTKPSKSWRVLLSEAGRSTRKDFRSSKAAYEQRRD